MLHPPPTPPEQSDIFTVKGMILDTRNERTPARPVDSGISLMNLTRKPCWHKEEGFRDERQTEFFQNKKIHQHHLKARLRWGGWERDRWVGWMLQLQKTPGSRPRSGAAVLGQEPLLVMYSETKLP